MGPAAGRQNDPSRPPYLTAVSREQKTFTKSMRVARISQIKEQLCHALPGGNLVNRVINKQMQIFS